MRAKVLQASGLQAQPDASYKFFWLLLRELGLGNTVQNIRRLTMKKVLVTTAAALACIAAFAQTPAKPPESGAVPISPKAAAAAESKVDARQAANPGVGPVMGSKAPETGSVAPNAKAAGKAEMNVASRTAADADTMMVMDTNGDGMISRKEYNDYHGGVWKKLKAKNGMVLQADMDAMLKGGQSR